MRWFRANRTFGGGLALFALALQLVLSFDHIHPQDIYGDIPLRASSALALLGGVQAQVQSSHQSADHDEYCLICATSSLLRNSVTVTAPQLPLPVASHGAHRAYHVAALPVPPRRAPFQSRAPPQA